MNFQLLRHATCLMTYQNQKILIDPVFSQKGALAPIAASPRPRRNPLTELPLTDSDVQAMIASLDFVIVTHLHTDHFDPAAVERLPKSMPILCQPIDETRLREYGFNNLVPIQDSSVVSGIRVRRFGGHHGKGKISEKMGAVSGFLLSSDQEPSIYFPGDTIWCEEVQDALTSYCPDIVAAFSGAAQFLVGGRITMSVCDIRKIASAVPMAKLIAVHMEAYNHCMLTRKKLSSFSEKHGFAQRLWIPENGEERSYFVPAL